MILNTKTLGVDKAVLSVREILSYTDRYYFVYTFGCQQNEADSEKIRAMAEDMGYKAAKSAECADLVIVNTCAIREHAEMKALSLLGGFRKIKNENPDFILGVVGCMAAEKHIKDRLKAKFPYVTFTLEPNMLHRLPETILSFLTQKRRTFILGEDNGDIVEGISSVRTNRHKAWVSIMYGCNNFCTYCIVPYVRGRERSRSSTDIINECSYLIEKGVREITLLGQNVNSYASDLDFPDLLSKIADKDGDFIIRFMTCHPKDTSDKLISVMAKYNGKIAPYFHLPLQSGSNAVLKKMNRTYTREHFMKIVTALREKIPNICLSTDVIVGFPGESETDFADTLDILERARFDTAYAFIYSVREGTSAAKMNNQIPEDIKSERLNRLFKVQDKISYEKNLPYLDKTAKILVDSCDERDGELIYTGRTDTNKLVHFTSKNAEIGQFINVKIEKIRAFDLIGAEF